MAKLFYTAITSLDGYIADANGEIDWGAPDAEVFDFINELEKNVGTYLYGRLMYETMVSWETIEASDDEPFESAFAEMWRAASKIVFSTTLAETSSARTIVERSFDPAAIHRLKRSSEGDLTINGANIAGQAFDAGLIDEIHLFVTPVLVGGGKPALTGDARTRVTLIDVKGFGSGVVHLHYRVDH